MIYEKLQKARVMLQETKLKKSGKNNYAGFEYFELKDFLPTVNKIFLELKMSSRFSINEMVAHLDIIDCENEKETITFNTPIETLELKGCNKLQALGGIHTYIKRYLYLNALEIVENDMFDPLTGKEKEDKNQNPQTTQTPKPLQKPKEENPVLKLKQKLKSANMNSAQMQQFCIIYNLSSKNPQGIEDFLANEENCNNTIINYLKEIA